MFSDLGVVSVPAQSAERIGSRAEVGRRLGREAAERLVVLLPLDEGAATLMAMGDEQGGNGAGDCFKTCRNRQKSWLDLGDESASKLSGSFLTAFGAAIVFDVTRRIAGGCAAVAMGRSDAVHCRRCPGCPETGKMVAFGRAREMAEPKPP